MASIDTLPDEILQIVFDVVVATDEKEDQRWKWRVSRLLVCKRWARLFEPRLYCQITFGDAQSRFQPEQLLEIIKQKLYLRDAIQAVHLLNPPNDNDYQAHLQFFEYVLPISELHIHKWSKQALPLLKQVAEAKRLTRLRCVSISLPAILSWFGHGSVQSLHLKKAFVNDSIDLKFFGSQEHGVSADMPEIMKGLDKRSGAVQHLIIQRSRLDPTDLDLFFRWPAALKTLEMTYIFSDYSLRSLQSTLDLHQNSLRQITLGDITNLCSQIRPEERVERINTSYLDFSPFSKLTHLALNVNFRFLSHAPAVLGLTIAPPNLVSLSLDLEPENHRKAAFPLFTGPAITWLVDFVKAVRESQAATRLSFQLNPPSAVFKHVHMNYQPWTHFRDQWLGFIRSVRDDPTYPWDYFEQAKSILDGQGVLLTWNEPKMTKENWHRAAESHLGPEAESDFLSGPVVEPREQYANIFESNLDTVTYH